MRKLLWFIAGILLICGCGDDQTTVIEPEPNKPPVIDRLILPTEIEAGTQLTLQVIARDPDKDKLSIIWQASQGTIENNVWTPPNHAAQAVISVHVTDKINPTVTQQHTINVIAPEPPPPPEPPPISEPQPPPTQEPLEPAQSWRIAQKVGLVYEQDGQPIAKVTLGDSLQVIKSISKEWLQSEDDARIFAFDIPQIGLLLCHFRNGKVAGIVTDDKRFKTDGGIGIGSHLNDVKAIYGKSNDIQGAYHTYPQLGYIFKYNEANRVASISIF